MVRRYVYVHYICAYMCGADRITLRPSADIVPHPRFCSHTNRRYSDNLARLFSRSCKIRQYSLGICCSSRICFFIRNWRYRHNQDFVSMCPLLNNIIWTMIYGVTTTTTHSYFFDKHCHVFACKLAILIEKIALTQERAINLS